MTEYPMEYNMLPAYMRKGMWLYVEKGVEPGGFLRAVLENDLFGAFGRADVTNQEMIGTYVRFIHNHVPSACWGSRKLVNEWIEAGGLEGMEKSMMGEEES